MAYKFNPLTGNLDLVNASGGGADEKVKVSATDTTANYLFNKFTLGFALEAHINDPSGNENIHLSVDESVLNAKYVRRDGTTALIADWDAGSFKITAEQFVSDVVTGTSPLVVASTTLINNLNADKLDGADASSTPTANQIVIADASGFLHTPSAAPNSDYEVANKKYVDDQITAEDLDFAGDAGTGSVDLDSQTFTIAGTANEIETSASGQTLTVGIVTNPTLSGILNILESSATTNAIVDVLKIDLESTGTAANGLGGGLLFEVDDDGGSLQTVSGIAGLWIDAAAGVKHGALIFGTRDAAVNDWTDAGFEKMRINHLGLVTIENTLQLNGNQINDSGGTAWITSDGSQNATFAGTLTSDWTNQDVSSASAPTFTATNITGIPAASILAGTFGTGAYVMDSTLEVGAITSTGASTFNSGSIDADFTVNWNSGTGLFVQGSDGFVGIGTASPDTILHVGVGTAGTASDSVWGSANNQGIFVDGNAARSVVIIEGSDTARLMISDSDGSVSQRMASFEITDGFAGIKAYNDGGGIKSGGNIMTFDLGGGTTGNVGIGTASPNTKLHVKGTSWTTMTIEADANDPVLQLTSDGSSDLNDWTMRMDVSISDKLQWRYDNSVKLTMDTSGNVGIGTASPVAKLHIDQSSTTEGIPVLVLDQADVSEGFINFIGSDRGVITGATNSLESVRVEINGVVRRIAVYVDA